MSNQGARGSAVPDFHTTHHCQSDRTSLHLNRGIGRGCVGFIRTHACLGCSIEMSSCSSIPVLFSLQASCWLLPRCSSVVQQQNLTGIRFTKASSAPRRRRRPPILTPASTFLWIETRVHVARTLPHACPAQLANAPALNFIDPAPSGCFVQDMPPQHAPVSGTNNNTFPSAIKAREASQV